MKPPPAVQELLPPQGEAAGQAPLHASPDRLSLPLTAEERCNAAALSQPELLSFGFRAIARKQGGVGYCHS